MHRPYSRSGGFTLIELLIVVVIISILAAMAAGGLVVVKRAAFVTTMKADLRRLAADQVIFYNTRLENDRRLRFGNMRQLQFVPTGGVTIRIRANATGWAARAQHEAVGRRKRCTMFHGNIRTFRPRGPEDVVFCD